MPRVRITQVDKSDAYYPQRDELIGLEGEATQISHTGHGLFGFIFKYTIGAPIYLIHAAIQLLDRKANSHHGSDISD